MQFILMLKNELQFFEGTIFYLLNVLKCLKCHELGRKSFQILKLNPQRKLKLPHKGDCWLSLMVNGECKILPSSWTSNNNPKQFWSPAVTLLPQPLNLDCFAKICCYVCVISYCTTAAKLVVEWNGKNLQLISIKKYLTCLVCVAWAFASNYTTLWTFPYPLI